MCASCRRRHQFCARYVSAFFRLFCLIAGPPRSRPALRSDRRLFQAAARLPAARFHEYVAVRSYGDQTVRVYGHEHALQRVVQRQSAMPHGHASSAILSPRYPEHTHNRPPKAGSQALTERSLQLLAPNTHQRSPTRNKQTLRAQDRVREPAREFKREQRRACQSQSA